MRRARIVTCLWGIVVILSAALMLDFLGEEAAAERIRAACADPVTGSTTDIGDAIAARVGN